MKRSVYLLPIIAALIMSYISSRYLFVGSALSLIPWSILALLCGVLARSKKEAVRLGAVYGFSQTFIFLWIDKAGKITLPQFFILLAIISGLGVVAACGTAVAARLGWMIRLHTRKQP